MFQTVSNKCSLGADAEKPFLRQSGQLSEPSILSQTLKTRMPLNLVGPVSEIPPLCI
jgi:hypothetical protein